MGRLRIVAVGVLALLTLLAGLGSGAAAAGNRKLVEGTVYDTTCATSCLPECPPPPHCGPITARLPGAVVCAQARRAIVCPLARDASTVCVPAGCSGFPIFAGDATAVVRHNSFPAALASVPVTDGHFRIRLAPGRYNVTLRIPGEGCWLSNRSLVRVTPRLSGPVPVALEAEDSCGPAPLAE